MSRETQSRMESLRELLSSGELSTQEELRERLLAQGFSVTQSTVSRDLKKLGAIRTTDARGQAVYRLPEEREPASEGGLGDLVLEVLSNGTLIVVRTAVGSASLVARRLDRIRPSGILGTIAGDDTIFIAPVSNDPNSIESTVGKIRDALGM